MKKIITLLCILISSKAFSQVSFGKLDASQSQVGQAFGGIAIFNNELYYRGFDAFPSINYLFKTDGTEANTTVLSTTINSPEFMFEFDGKLYFSGFQSNIGKEPFVTDGTPGGTVLIKDIKPGSGGSVRVSQGTEDDVLFIISNNTLFFSADDGVNREQIWKTDGTEAGTVMVTNLPNGIQRFKTQNVISYNNELYFVGIDNSNTGFELYKTDGTSVNLVKDIFLGTASSLPFNFTIFNGLLYFSARTAENGDELWRTDGTSAGTQLVHDFYDNGTSNPDFFKVFDGHLYLVANTFDSNTNSVRTNTLIKTDGTSYQFVNADGFKTANSPGFFTYNNELYLSGKPRPTAGSISGEQIWKTDGTDIGTEAVVTTNTFSRIFAPVEYGDNLYFISSQQLWSTDGSDSGTEQLTDFGNIDTPNILNNFGNTANTLFDNRIWFNGTNGGIQELWYLGDASVLSNPETERLPSDLIMYPNPTSDVVNINEKANSSKRVFNSSGKLLLETKDSKIDLGHFSKGIYFIEITLGNHKVCKKIIKI